MNSWFVEDDRVVDCFWDLASMLPSRNEKKDRQLSQIPDYDSSCDYKTENPTQSHKPAEFVLLKKSNDNIDSQTEFGVQARSFVDGEECYRPTDTRLLTYVKINRFQSSYSFYSKFREDAKKYFYEEGSPCNPVSFFSYIPQYAQMTSDQKNYYFYWRSKVRAHEYPSCDVSYVWLYIYEIINLPDLLAPEEGAKLLAVIWREYRKKYAKIDKYMTVWLADYCLVYQQPCPIALLSSFLPSILENEGFKEFYLCQATENNDFAVLTVLSLASVYQWQNSKFIQKLQQSQKYHMICALRPVVRMLVEEEGALSSSEKECVLIREAFSGSLCAHNIKCRIEVGYRSLEHSCQLGKIITAAVKYTENQLRSLFGQKSRLSVGEELPEQYKMIIDVYFEPLAEKHSMTPGTKPEYEKKYDAQTTGINLVDALRIENASWENTRKLVPDETEMQEVDCAADFGKDESAPDRGNDENNLGLRVSLTEKDHILLECLFSKGAIRATFEALDMAERINAVSTDLIGDVVISICEDECFLVEEYREELLRWFNSL